MKQADTPAATAPPATPYLDTSKPSRGDQDTAHISFAMDKLSIKQCHLPPAAAATDVQFQQDKLGSSPQQATVPQQQQSAAPAPAMPVGALTGNEMAPSGEPYLEETVEMPGSDQECAEPDTDEIMHEYLLLGIQLEPASPEQAAARSRVLHVLSQPAHKQFATWSQLMSQLYLNTNPAWFQEAGCQQLLTAAQALPAGLGPWQAAFAASAIASLLSALAVTANGTLPCPVPPEATLKLLQHGLLSKAAGDLQEAERRRGAVRAMLVMNGAVPGSPLQRSTPRFLTAVSLVTAGPRMWSEGAVRGLMRLPVGREVVDECLKALVDVPGCYVVHQLFNICASLQEDGLAALRRKLQQSTALEPLLLDLPAMWSAALVQHGAQPLLDDVVLRKLLFILKAYSVVVFAAVFPDMQPTGEPLLAPLFPLDVASFLLLVFAVQQQAAGLPAPELQALQAAVQEEPELVEQSLRMLTQMLLCHPVHSVTVMEGLVESDIAASMLAAAVAQWPSCEVALELAFHLRAWLSREDCLSAPASPAEVSRHDGRRLRSSLGQQVFRELQDNPALLDVLLSMPNSNKLKARHLLLR